MKTYLLVWNPKRWDWKTLGADAAATRAGGRVPMEWSCRNTHVKSGDRVFLVRLGSEPRGVMASGWATSESQTGEHFDPSLASEGQKRNYIEVEFEHVIVPETEPILPVTELSSPALSQFPWNSRFSGMNIPESVASELEELWELHTANAPKVGKSAPAGTTAEEGAISLRIVRHRRREASLREAKIAEFKSKNGGRLHCEVPGCGFDFEKRYGNVGRDYAQVHHLRPLADCSSPTTTGLDDLAVVCANCHVMIHRGGACRPLPTLIP